jgi:N-acetylglucosaminylphosphatidylinositol deacetylase
MCTLYISLRYKVSNALLFRFFTPTIRELRKQNTLYILCLSNGGFDGLGKVRDKEMHASGKNMGFQEVTVIDDPELQDGMTSYWDTGKVAKVIENYLVNK